jgi:flagellar motor switch protein FliG
MDDKTIVLTLYGTKESISDFSIALFDDNSKAFDFCSNINELNQKDDEWVYAAIIKEHQKTKLVKPGYTDFDILASLDDRSIQKLLNNIDIYESFPMALRIAKKDVLRAVFRNMSRRRASMLIEYMEYMGPITLKQAQEAQQQITSIIRHMEDIGEIVVPKSSQDKVV